MKKIKYLFIASFVLFFALGLIFSFSAKTAQALNLRDAFLVDNKSKKDILDATADKAGFSVEANNPAYTVSGRIAQIINIALSFVGVIFLILMIYGGYLWMMDRGNDAQVKKARGLIESAVIGMIIVVSAYAITYFVVSRFNVGNNTSEVIDSATYETEGYEGIEGDLNETIVDETESGGTQGGGGGNEADADQASGEYISQ